MNMENPNKDLIRFIDAILHEMEISPKQDKITLSNLTLPFPSNFQNLIKQDKFFKKLKGEAAADSEILGFKKLPLFYIITKPNKEKLLEMRKSISELDDNVEELSVKNRKTKADKKSGVVTIFLENSGDLWREPKSKYCYPMGESSGRHKIVRFFATHGGYQKTSDITLALEGKDEQLIRKEIGKIRGNIKKFLKLNGKDVIEMRKGSGYRIGPSYKIIPKN